MPDYIVTFTRTQECSITIKAKSKEDAFNKFDSGKYNDNEVEVQHESISIDEVLLDE